MAHFVNKEKGEALNATVEKFLFFSEVSNNYSATHKTKHDTIYALDAYDAYREQLVKRILVQGFSCENWSS